MSKKTHREVKTKSMKNVCYKMVLWCLMVNTLDLCNPKIQVQSLAKPHILLFFWFVFFVSLFLFILKLFFCTLFFVDFFFLCFFFVCLFLRHFVFSISIKKPRTLKSPQFLLFFILFFFLLNFTMFFLISFHFFFDYFTIKCICFFIF